MSVNIKKSFAIKTFLLFLFALQADRYKRRNNLEKYKSSPVYNCGYALRVCYRPDVHMVVLPGAVKQAVPDLDVG